MTIVYWYGTSTPCEQYETERKEHNAKSLNKIKSYNKKENGA